VPWKSLAQLEPLRGSLCVVLAEPGGGKSAFALNWAARLLAPSAVLSLDTDLTTQAVRTAAILGQTPMDVVKQNPVAWSNFLKQRAAHVRMYDVNVNARETLQLVNAETEFWGEPPVITVIDNVSNLVREGGYEEYRNLFVSLHRVARMGNTFVLALHHVTRGHVGRHVPLTLASGQYSGEQEAELVLGLWSKHPDYMNVSVLKNRLGQADASGRLYSSLRFDRPLMSIRDMTDTEKAVAAIGGLV
jgi:hypothetical protein